MKKITKYSVKEQAAIIGYVKNGIAGKGEWRINIELTQLASSTDTNTSNILLQYNPVIYIMMTAMIIWIIFFIKSTLM